MKREVALVLALSLVSTAQQPQTATFRTSATLVEFSIVARDENGKPVTDLKKEEISIRESGRAREVAVFQYDGAVAKRLASEPLPPGTFSNRPEHTSLGPHRNLIAIVLDPINTPRDDQISALSQVLRYLRELPANSRVAVYRLGHVVDVIHDFTDDIDSVRNRIANLDPVILSQRRDPAFGIQPPAGSESSGAAAEATAGAKRALAAGIEAIRHWDLFLTVDALEALGNHLAGIPGRKSLIWIGNGIPLPNPPHLRARVRLAAQRLASQGMAVYPTDAKGIEGGVPAASEQGIPGRRLPGRMITFARSRQWASMDIMAEVSGGRVAKFSNDPTSGLTLAASDQRGAYSLSFYTGEPDNQWHRLQVKVTRPGVSLLHQEGYLSTVPSERPQEWSAEEWRMEAINPVGSTSVRFDVRCQLAAGALDATVLIAADDLHFRNSVANIEIGIAEKNGAGLAGLSHVQGTIGLPEKGATIVRYTSRSQISPEATTVRLIVRDRSTGRYGTLDLAVKDIPTAR